MFPCKIRINNNQTIMTVKMKKYIKPVLIVQENLLAGQLLFGSEIKTEITDGGAAKETFGAWIDEDDTDEE